MSTPGPGLTSKHWDIVISSLRRSPDPVLLFYFPKSFISFYRKLELPLKQTMWKLKILNFCTKRRWGGSACSVIFSFICMKSHNVSLGLIYIKSRMTKHKNKGLHTKIMATNTLYLECYANSILFSYFCEKILF